MSTTITIEIPAASEALVRQLLALHEELQALALSAADGTVLGGCEAAVIPKGRDPAKNLLADAVARRIGATPQACNDSPDAVVEPGDWRATCPACRKTHHRYKRPGR